MFVDLTGYDGGSLGQEDLIVVSVTHTNLFPTLGSWSDHVLVVGQWHLITRVLCGGEHTWELHTMLGYPLRFLVLPTNFEGMSVRSSAILQIHRGRRNYG